MYNRKLAIQRDSFLAFGLSSRFAEWVKNDKEKRPFDARSALCPPVTHIAAFHVFIRIGEAAVPLHVRHVAKVGPFSRKARTWAVGLPIFATGSHPI